MASCDLGSEASAWFLVVRTVSAAKGWWAAAVVQWGSQLAGAQHSRRHRLPGVRHVQAQRHLQAAPARPVFLALRLRCLPRLLPCAASAATQWAAFSAVASPASATTLSRWRKPFAWHCKATLLCIAEHGGPAALPCCWAECAGANADGAAVRCRCAAQLLQPQVGPRRRHGRRQHRSATPPGRPAPLLSITPQRALSRTCGTGWWGTCAFAWAPRQCWQM